MISDLDILTSAQVLLQKHGHDAMAEAQKMISKYRETGPKEPLAIWKKIATAITTITLSSSTGKIIH